MITGLVFIAVVGLAGIIAEIAMLTRLVRHQRDCPYCRRP